MSFPLNSNDAYIKSTGERSTLGAELGGSTSIPTASDTTKGGVKIGARLTMSGEVLSADAQVPAHTISEAGKVLTVANDGSLEWDVKGEGGGDMLLDYFEHFTTTGSHTMSKSFTVPETGTYFIFAGFFCTDLTVKINDVTESNTVNDSGSFIHCYHQSAKELTKNDVITISGTSSGATVFMAAISKNTASDIEI